MVADPVIDYGEVVYMTTWSQNGLTDGKDEWKGTDYTPVTIG